MTAISIETEVTSDHHLDLKLPADFPAGPVRVTVESVLPPESDIFQSQTELGKRLLEIRRRAIAKGMELLSWDEVNEEVRRRRGGLGDE